eukprot:TRINITY_DN8366_c0_g1_i1.p1 TRINITY_DN8366_c0_g1~~TRINITY_DN8366_c0_g1_i1.p1  ORF type:complete len:152 (+),score=1.01 TRINITY_DN8366_c0_g1_i1:72-527(+)
MRAAEIGLTITGASTTGFDLLLSQSHSSSDSDPSSSERAPLSRCPAQLSSSSLGPKCLAMCPLLCGCLRSRRLNQKAQLIATKLNTMRTLPEGFSGRSSSQRPAAQSVSESHDFLSTSECVLLKRTCEAALEGPSLENLMPLFCFSLLTVE